MALASAKQLLDELMGRDRDLTLDEGKKREYSWDSSDICKNFLVKFCPHDLFVNTKADLGACSRIHDERLKREYEKSSRYQKMGYEEDFLRFCQSMLSDVDKRIRRARQRLLLSSQHAETQQQQPPKNGNEEKTKVLTERINGLLIQVENLGCEGKVEEAQGIMKLCEQLKEEREALRKQTEANHWFQTAEIAAAQEKQMEVCDVCGAFLIVGDAQQRVDDHLQGKQHMGYARLKEAVDEILGNREKERYDREKQREKDREERRRLKDEEDRKRDERRKTLDDERKRDVDKQRNRDRHKRSRSRDRHRSRSYERGRDRHSKDKNRKDDKSKHKHRSRSKERKHHRSRSRDSAKHSHKSASHSPDRKEKERKDKKEKEKNKEHKKHSHENGEDVKEKPSIEKENDNVDASKGHSIAGESE